jgi:hypothetical protein
MPVRVAGVRQLGLRVARSLPSDQKVAAGSLVRVTGLRARVRRDQASPGLVGPSLVAASLLGPSLAVLSLVAHPVRVEKSPVTVPVVPPKISFPHMK